MLMRTSCQLLAARGCIARPVSRCSSRRRVAVGFTIKDFVQQVLASNIKEQDKVELVIELAQAEMETKLVQAEMETKLAQLKLVLAETRLGAAVADAMLLQGKLHMRGIIEEVEQRLLPAGADNVNRTVNWRTILQHPGNRQLLVRMQKCMHGKPTARKVADRVVALYQHLSGYMHNVSSTAVDIMEGPVNREQMELLVCMADACGIPYNIRRRSVVGSSQQDDAGSSEGEPGGDGASCASGESAQDAMQS